jgi:hypothetical protein
LGSIDIAAAARSILLVGRIDDGVRAFVQIKCNIATPGRPQAFALDPVSGFSWLGECDVTAGDLLNGSSQESP